MSVTDQVIEKVKAMSPEEIRQLFAYIKQLEREEKEDRLDVESARRALDEADEKGWIPWEQVKAELGLTASPIARKTSRPSKTCRH